MTTYTQLNSYKTWLSSTGNMGVLISNSEKYYEILRDAFVGYKFSAKYPDEQQNHEYYFYINGIEESERLEVVQLLELFKTAVSIEGILSQTFALDMHHYPFYEGGGRTEIGQLIYDIKYANLPMPDRQTSAMKLVNHFAKFILSHPSYGRADFLIATPFFGNKSFDIPEFLVNQLSNMLKITNGNRLVQKTRKTRPMKDAGSEEEKFNIIRDAFAIVDKNRILNKRVIIVDDIYQSGNTLPELASTLQNAGAEVLGLVATKTLRTFNQDFQR